MKAKTARIAEGIQEKLIKMFSHMMTDDLNKIISKAIGQIKEDLLADMFRETVVMRSSLQIVQRRVHISYFCSGCYLAA